MCVESGNWEQLKIFLYPYSLASILMYFGMKASINFRFLSVT